MKVFIRRLTYCCIYLNIALFAVNIIVGHLLMAAACLLSVVWNYACWRSLGGGE